MALFNNKPAGPSVSTNCMVSYGDTTKLTVSYWNTQLSIKMAPCVGVNEDGLRSYADDKSQIIMTALTPDNLYSLKEAFASMLKPAIDAGTASSISVTVGNAPSKKIVTIGYDGTDMFIAITVNVDDRGIGNAGLTHKFKKTGIIKDYDPSIGVSDTKNIESEFAKFWSFVDGCYFATTGAIAHANRYSDATRASFSGSSGGNFPQTNFQPRPVQTGVVHNPVAAIAASTSAFDEFPF